MDIPEHLAVFTTLPSREQAQALSRELLARELVACAQIHSIDSLYRWQDKVCEDTEWRLLLKTRATLYDAVQAAICELHPYELPAIYAVPMTRVFDIFGGWLHEQTRAASPATPGAPPADSKD